MWCGGVEAPLFSSLSAQEGDGGDSVPEAFAGDAGEPGVEGRRGRTGLLSRVRDLNFIPPLLDSISFLPFPLSRSVAGVGDSV